MSTMLIACNETRESGSFMGDQLCSLKTAYLMVENQPDVDKLVITCSRRNEMHFLWEKFIEKHSAHVVWDDWNPGDWSARWINWDRWRLERRITDNAGQVIEFDHYRELYLRIHGCQRQYAICGSERGLGRRNIYEYWLAGQENCPDEFPGADWFDDTLIHHPPRVPYRDVYISPLAKTQGNYVFTFEFWSEVVHRLVERGVSVTVGLDQPFCEELTGNHLYRKHWGDHKEWMDQVCGHKLVACGNTGTGWLACACGVPMITMEPPDSQMPDHRYRECGLRNIVEVVDFPNPDYVARRITEEVARKVVMTTGCYDILHSGHVRHLERSKALGTKLIVALNSDASVRSLKGEERPINPEGQRKAVIEALRCVDEVVLFDGPNALPVIEKTRPDVLTAGFGYTPKDVVGRDLVEGYGGRVVVTCEGDAKDEPSTTKIYQAWRPVKGVGDVNMICKTGAVHSVNPYEKLRLLAEEFVQTLHLEGAVADLGTYRGGSALVLRRLAPDKDLHLFDTWAGTPHDDPLCHHKKGEWPARMEECVQILGRPSAEPSADSTYYHKGIFPKTAEEADLGRFCFVYVDMDTYQSTVDAITFFWERLVPGGKMLFDDYGWEPCAGVKKAVDETFRVGEGNGAPVRHEVYGYKAKVIGYTCVVEKL